MQIKNFIKPSLPHVVAVIVFITLAFAFFYPVLEGKALRANDSMVAKIYSKEISDFRQEFGKEPLWTNAIFCGMPAYLISTQYPGNLFKKVDLFLRIFGMPVSVLFISLAGFYILLLMFGVNPWLALAGSLAYGFSSFFFQVIAAGHNTQAIAIAYMAPMIGGIWYAYRKDAIKGALITAVFMALELVANHPQMTYYALLCILLFILVEFIYSLKERVFPKFLKTSALLLASVTVAVGINFAFLYSTYEYGKYSMRGKSDLVSESGNMTSGLKKDYIVQWSYGIGETMNLLIPNFKGGSSHPFDRDSETFKVLRQNNIADRINMTQKYWGDQPGTEGPVYIGAIVVFLFVLGLILIKGRERWWLAFATILAIMLAWGKNFMPLTDLFIDYFPGYNKFRSVTFILIIVQFCMPLLGILALKEIFFSDQPAAKLRKALLTASGIMGGILLLILVFPGVAGSFLAEYEEMYPASIRTAMIADRKDLLKADTVRGLLFILFGAGTIIAFLYGKIRKELSIALLGLLILADQWGAGKRYLNADRFAKPSVIQKSLSPTTADAEILKDKSYYRVWNRTVSTFQDNSPTSYFHKSIGGYHGAKLRRYQELIDSAIGRDIFRFDSIVNSVKTTEEVMTVFGKTSVLNMLNTKYVIFNPNSAPLQNPNALGNAWFIQNAILAENANEELSRLLSINTAKEAIVDRKFIDLLKDQSFQVDSTDMIELKLYRPNELIYNYSAGGERMVVFSEIYYPAGWKCFVDGNESSYFRANYVLRAMVVPQGSHEIRFVFEPSSYYTGNKVSLASSILLLLLVLGFAGMKLLKKETPS